MAFMTKLILRNGILPLFWYDGEFFVEDFVGLIAWLLRFQVQSPSSCGY